MFYNNQIVKYLKTISVPMMLKIQGARHSYTPLVWVQAGTHLAGEQSNNVIRSNLNIPLDWAIPFIHLNTLP